MTYEQLEQTVKSLGYKFFNNSINMIGERTNDVFTDNFTDKLHVAHSGKIFTIPWTTKPGSYYVKNPVTAYGTNITTGAWENIQGCATLREGQYRNVWQFVDNYWQWLSYPYFSQVAPVVVYRDNDRNNTMDRNAVQHVGVFGINGHRMSNNGQATGIIYTWSAGCQGAPEPEFKKILPLIREDVKKFGNLFSYTLIKSEDVLQ
jgi:hypothetical protein